MEQTNLSVKKELDLIKLVSLVSAVLAVLITIVFFSWWGLKDRFVFGGKDFNQVEWITAKPSAEKRCYRGEMAYDIKNHVLQIGMTREATTLKLGRPTWEDANIAEYDLGYCLWDIHGLTLFFNGQNQLMHMRISQH